MKFSTNIKHLRISPKKMREVAKAVVGFSPQQAIDRLTIFGNKAAKLLVKAIKSAQANEVNNFKKKESSLRIKAIIVSKGAFLKRFRPVSRGRAHRIKKRTSHIKIVLEETH